ncbi:DUF6090 family protein [Psychroserpens sp.]|uniref:DUF6090 family protein n=1 Tax=Psychroserpens sp. TaxID=2020870 RepID=UPI001B1D6B01|nr:DUF6090 family protein [Psychroserpens sp.]MBO6606659.1 hypothetical protein [Psychroserpens sp.]MBO6631850.1 hypothetical protein [Psychroserpens sp.]MBO6653363.1 hypothetical protein [Psychroserpens sp.]MBO6680610.1 hypothetical protein [Psychroserpens sp.]MBO6750432.1 hypothetical protein [Psychroserpens sp.]
MIKFFRKIRHKLLNENKLSKYLLYAAGEIILVIVGILIALSINTKVENQKRQDEIKDFLNIIKNDISKTVVDVKELKTYRDSSKYYSYKSLEIINSNLELGIQDISKVFSTNYNPNASKKLVYNKSAFNSLISSGLMTKIKNPKIRDALINYYEVVGELEKWETTMNEDLKYINRELFLEVGIINLYDYYSNPNEILDKHQMWFNKFVNSHFLHAFHAGNLDDLKIYNGYSKLIKKGEQLIELIESEYY